MTAISHPVRFSEHFRLTHEVFSAAGAFDPILNADTPLFVDPLLLEQSAHPEMRQAHDAWIQRFESILRVLTASNQPGDAAWRAGLRLFNFPEFAGTCLGYGAGIQGRGMGLPLRTRLLTTAKEIINLGIDDPELFTLIPLIEEDVGPDLISDMTTRVIASQLTAYTQRVLAERPDLLQPIRIDGQEFRLPLNPFFRHPNRPMPVLLVPNDVLRDLPTASDWDDVARVASENERYREEINARIADIWVAKNRRDKSLLRRQLLSSKDAFESVLEAVRNSERAAYDVERDPDGRHKWLDDAHAIAMAMPLHIAALTSRNQSAIQSVVDVIVAKFRELVEANGLWRHFWVDDKLRHESYAQLLFFAIAESYCEANNIDISPEVDAGGGPVDFKFSTGYHGRVVVEIKLSSNRRLSHGYTTQLEAYKRGERNAAGVLLIIDVGQGANQIEKVLELETEARNAGDGHSSVHVVDGTPKRSASKL